MSEEKILRALMQAQVSGSRKVAADDDDDDL
jgi:hypothetical protein